MKLSDTSASLTEVHLVSPIRVLILITQRAYEHAKDATYSRLIGNNGQWKIELLRYWSSLSRQLCLSVLQARLLRHLLSLSSPSFCFSLSFFVASTLTRNIRVKLWCALPLSAGSTGSLIDRSIYLYWDWSSYLSEMRITFSLATVLLFPSVYYSFLQWPMINDRVTILTH